MIIFGGFVQGSRVNEIYQYFFKENKWEKVVPLSHIKPLPRSGHSAVVRENCLVIYGGKDDSHNKLNDIWEFNLLTHRWNQLIPSITGYTPLSRSGHTACLYEDLMIVFGGIHEITREMEDLFFLDFKRNKWVLLYDEVTKPNKVYPFSQANSPAHINTPLHKRIQEDRRASSPTKSFKPNKFIGSRGSH
mmetsp:Transcript_32372/g.31673  ORF Transcript_32372/g.31673 Transcript_32372/m.31673 type:complete len:190 (+) Transcript_32372:330-899(+)